MMYCPNCNQEFEGTFCPECGTKLIERPSIGGLNLNLGDANAISGDVNLQDSHNAYNIRNTSSTINDNSTTTNIVYEAQKSADQIHAENIKTFLAEVVQLMDSPEGLNDNGLLSAEAFHQLTLLRLQLMLSQQEAENLIAQVQHSKLLTMQQKQSEREAKLRTLTNTSIPTMPKFDAQSVQLNQMQGWNPLQAAQQMGLGISGMPQMPTEPTKA